GSAAIPRSSGRRCVGRIQFQARPRQATRPFLRAEKSGGIGLIRERKGRPPVRFPWGWCACTPISLSPDCVETLQTRWRRGVDSNSGVLVAKTRPEYCPEYAPFWAEIVQAKAERKVRFVPARTHRSKATAPSSRQSVRAKISFAGQPNRR